MQEKRVLITGITGFVGSHLAELCIKKGFKVYGTHRWRSRVDNVKHLLKDVTFIETDILDKTSVLNCLRLSKPDYVFHLAAQSFVATSWKVPNISMLTNVDGQINLFEAIRELGLNPTIQIACSSEEYGMVYPHETPIRETNPLRPLSPYAVSKVAQDLLGYQYFKSYGMKIIRTRGFNHTGARRGDVFVTSTFAKQFAEIEAGLRKPVLFAGDLSPQRDFTDVRDMVAGYILAVEKGVPGEVYNLCFGKAYSIRNIVEILSGYTGITPEIQLDQSRLRPSDVPLLLGDNTKFSNQTGWKPEIPFETTLKDTLNYWRARIKAEDGDHIPSHLVSHT